MSDLLDEIKQLVLLAIEGEDVELVDVQLKGRSGSQSLRVYVDSQSGVTLDVCARVSRSISDQLDIADVISGKYRLEVSSPGLSRPLLTSRDFHRNLNKEVEVVLDDGAEQTTVKGKVVEVRDAEVCIEGPKGIIRFPVSVIVSGKLCLPW